MLPSSGSISLSQINTELSRAYNSQISLDAAENGSYGAINQNSSVKPSSANPAAMSEWRGYNHGCTAVSISPASVTINQGQSTTLTASGSSSYSWNTGATSASITVSPSSTTTYTVTGTTTGCIATGATRTVTVNAVTTTTTCTPAGTPLGGQYCLGQAMYQDYADGNCGQYSSQIDPCHVDCGCTPVACTETTFTNSKDGPVEIRYFACAGNQVTRSLPPYGGQWIGCVLDGSEILIEPGNEEWVQIDPKAPCSSNSGV
jgi:hypothetical protein